MFGKAKKWGFFLPLWVSFLMVPQGTAAPIISTLQDQQSVAITVYNNNIALVKDTRLIPLRTGVQELKFMDVAGKINPATVRIKSLAEGMILNILEQNYEYDLISPQKLLEKFVGQKVELVWMNPESKKETVVEATLLSTQGGNIFQIGDKITIGHPGRIVLPKIPENLSRQPSLVWLLENKFPKPQRMEVTYLTSGINWKADYLAVLNPSDTLADFTGWVTIENRSGVVYRNALLKLVAGEVHQVKEERRIDRPIPLAAKEAAPQFKEEPLFEYHLYTLDRGTTLQDNETKQLVLFHASQVPVSKLFIFQGQPSIYWARMEAKGQRQRVGVFLELVNRTENRLGIPLPKGIVRVYQEDREGTLQFVGEDRIDHTAKNEKMKVKIGEAFDLTAERIQTDYKHLDSKLYEVTFEVTLRNQKNEDIKVFVEEPIPGDWEMISNTHAYEKIQGNLVRFHVPVAKGQEAKVRYKVRFRY